MSKAVTRRRFNRTAALAGASITILPRHVLGRGYQAPSDTVYVAGIGAGGKGRSDIAGCADAGAQIAALCDIDFRYASASVQAFPEAKRYSDYRRLLDQESGIDAVTVSTPDHTHAIIALEAMRRGKHVFCQKPLTRTLRENRMLMDTARETGVATQMGNQGHAMEGTRQIREWLEAGLIGELQSIEFWTNRPIWAQALRRPTEAHHVPAQIDWDQWIGPSPERPYHPDYYHPFSWRGWWDFGTGALGDMACHIMDAAFWTYDLRDPERVIPETTALYPESAPASTRVEYQFAARGNRPAVSATWRDGGLRPPRHPAFEGDEWPLETSGQAFFGDKGVLVGGTYGQDPILYPKSLRERVEAEPLPVKYPRTDGVFAEFIEGCKGNGTPGSSFPEHAGPLTEMVLLGNLAIRSGEEITWDSERMTTGSKNADQYIDPVVREGWSLT